MRIHEYVRILALGCTIIVTIRLLTAVNQYFDYSDVFPEIHSQQDGSVRRSLARPNQSESVILYQPSEPCLISTRTPGRDPLDGRWYNFSSRNFLLYAYSAFVDDRPSLLSQPVIRILATANRIEAVAKNNVSVTLFCRLYYEADDNVHIVPMARHFSRAGVNEKLYDEDVMTYVLTCPLNQSIQSFPIALSVLRSQHEDYVNWESVQACMPVELPVKQPSTRDFAICVPAMYGGVQPMQLIEWLEMQKLLGVSFVGFLSYYLGQPALDVLEVYAREGFVDVRFSDFLFHPKSAYTQRILHSTLAVNDCMYRHMYNYKRMPIIDIDEVIFPVHVATLQELVAYLEHTMSKNCVVYEFRNQFYYLNIVTNDTTVNRRPYNLTFLKHRLKGSVSAPRHAAKSIINPQACVAMHHHRCWSFTAGFELYPNWEPVDFSIATNRHYRMCNWGKALCDKSISGATLDDGMLRFADALEEQVRKRIETSFPNLLVQ